MINQDKTMKFRDPKTGEVFEEMRDAWTDWCCRRDCSRNCVINKLAASYDSRDCYKTCERNPAEAARLMDLEVVEDSKGVEIDPVTPVEGLCCDCVESGPCCDFSENEDCPSQKEDGSCWRPYTEKEEPMEKTDKPRICDVLGVDVGERFTVDGYCPTVKAFWIAEDGLFETDPPKFPGTSCAMMQAINHPDRIIRKPRFTQEEVAVLRYLCAIGIMNIKRCGPINIFWRSADMADIMTVPVGFLPSLLPGQSISLADLCTS